MAVVQDKFRLTNNDNSKGIKFHWAGNVSDRVQPNIISIPLAGSDSSQNLVFNLGGFKRIISLDFRLLDNGEDKSTSTDSIVTVIDQWDFLIDTVLQGQTSGQEAVSFTLQIWRGTDETPAKTYNGYLEDLGVNPIDGTPYVNGSLVFTVGDTVF